MKLKIAMTIDNDVIAKFQEHCRNHGYKVSTRVEILMKNDMGKK